MHTRGVEPGDYVDFLLDLPGCPAPIQDLFSLIPDPGGDFVPNAFFFKNLTLEDVLSETVRCCGSRCAGADGIHIKQVLDEVEKILPRPVDLFNRIVATCTYPESWKCSVIIPIPKCLNPSKLADYRPIAIQLIFSKILDGVSLEQIIGFLEGRNFFEPRQFGFRRGLSCEHAVLDFVEGIRSDRT